MCPVGADLERVQRKAEIVDRAGRAREVVDEVDRLVHVDVVDQVLVYVAEVGGADVLDVLEGAGLQVVHADHPAAALEKVFAEMRAQKPAPTGDQRSRHCRHSLAKDCNKRQPNEIPSRALAGPQPYLSVGPRENLS